MRYWIYLIPIAFLMMQSCKDDDKPTPAEERCQIAYTVIAGDSLFYHYNEEGLLTEVTGGRTISLEHDGSKLTSYTENSVTFTLNYGNGDRPERITETENGNVIRYIDLQYTNGLITQFEYRSPQEEVQVHTEITYDSRGALLSMKRDEYDPSAGQLITFVEVDSVGCDSVANPFSTDPDLRLLHLEEPTALGSFNAQYARFQILGIVVSAEFSLEYDGDNRLIRSVGTFDNPGVPENVVIFEYDCQ